jgi:protein tyrosine phosphatase (PTP) superfamily phosphohydrolase (DUF442 family)
MVRLPANERRGTVKHLIAILILLSAVTCPAVGKQAIYPQMIGQCEFSGEKKYEQAALGKSARYQSSDTKIDIFYYNKGIKNIPDGIGDRVKTEMLEVRTVIRELEKRGDYRNVKFEKDREIEIGGVKFLTNKCFLEQDQKNGQGYLGTRTSYSFIAGKNSNFLKIRATYNGEANEDTDKSISDFVAESLKIKWDDDGKVERPAKWAVPIKLDGVPNLHKVTDNLYRSAQPTDEGMKKLDELGIKTVINLRAFHSDKDEIKGTDILNERLNVKTWHIEDEDVVKFLKIVRKKENGPFLVHCQHGADRTGLMNCMFRIIEEGWSKEDAIKELTEGGYGFHPVWKNIIDYIGKIDIEKIKKSVVEAESPE